MTRATIRTSAARYVVLGFLTIFAVVIQVRLSVETVHTVRTLDYYVPFLIEPFTAKVYALDSSMNWEKGHQSDARALKYSVLRGGDRVVRVNDKLFTGLSLYLTELRNAQRRTSDFFSVTVVTRSGHTRVIEFGFPHCTCGVPGRFEAAVFWMIAPLFCILVGALTAVLRPRSVLAWSFFALMLSLSQLQFWHEPYSGFQLTINPMMWPDGMRIPALIYRSFVQHAWPAVIAIAAMHFSGKSRRHPLRSAFVAVLLLFAVAKASVAVAWSEGIQSLSPLYSLFEQYQTEGLVFCFVLSTAAAWGHNRRIGILVGVIASFAVAALFIGPAPITSAEWISYSGETRRFRPTMPEFHRSPGMIVAVSVTTFLLASLLLFWRRLSWRPVVAATLFLPLATHVSASLGNWWWPFGGPSWELWPWMVIFTAALGIVVASCWIVRREHLPHLCTNSTDAGTGNQGFS